jgi:hypothetical protein
MERNALRAVLAEASMTGTSSSGGGNLLNASQFGFRALQSTTLQYMRLADHVTLNFNNEMSTAAVFLDIEKAYDTTWHPGLLYKLSKLKFLTRIIKLIS